MKQQLVFVTSARAACLANANVRAFICNARYTQQDVGVADNGRTVDLSRGAA